MTTDCYLKCKTVIQHNDVEGGVRSRRNVLREKVLCR